ncbi:CPBP family intramembrane glutamic endopeptidase [Haloglomus salinum]|uniref:CPBP family intramembrane glutamic endopeptidase n=1 Tax=Haloglomus salinum TaxID=2962673 RepID=UPI0020C9BDC8|nr:CPBP family intramembrane glutamic endopeptidase [Haloglomus salinum]
MSTDTKQSRSRPGVSLAIIVGLVVALFGSTLVGQLDLAERLGTSAAESLLVNSVTMWVLVGGLLALVLYWEDRPLASVGLERPTRRQVIGGIGAGVVALVLGLLATGLAVAALNLQQPETLSTISSLSLPVKLAIIGTAVVTEEVLWRGYPIERLTELTGSIWIGAATSFVVFLAVHYPAWGLVGAIPQAVFALALVGVYVWSRNVIACILTHAVINSVMILVLPTFL